VSNIAMQMFKTMDAVHITVQRGVAERAHSSLPVDILVQLHGAHCHDPTACARIEHDGRGRSEWELVLHASFDGELGAADSLACELHLGRCQRCFGEMKKLKSMRRKFKRSAVGWFAPGALRNRFG
jgi:hypothetical protein